MELLINLLSIVLGIGLTSANVQGTPKTKEVVNHKRPRGVATVSETTVSKPTDKGASKSSNTVTKTAKAKPTPGVPNGNKSAQDGWDGK